MDADSLAQKLRELESGILVLHDFTKKFFAWATSQHQDFKVNKLTFPIQNLF